MRLPKITLEKYNIYREFQAERIFPRLAVDNDMEEILFQTAYGLVRKSPDNDYEIKKGIDLYGFETFYKHGKINLLDTKQSENKIKKKLKKVAKHRLFTEKDYNDWSNTDIGFFNKKDAKYSKIKLGYCYLDHTGMNYIVYNFKDDKFYYFNHCMVLEELLRKSVDVYDPYNGCFGYKYSYYSDNVESMIKFINKDIKEHYEETNKTKIFNESDYIRSNFYLTNRKIKDVGVYLFTDNKSNINSQVNQLDRDFIIARKLYNDMCYESKNIKKFFNKNLIKEISNLQYRDILSEIRYSCNYTDEFYDHGYYGIFTFLYRSNKKMIFYIKEKSNNKFDIFVRLIPWYNFYY